MPNVYTFKDFEGSSHRILLELIRRHAPRGGTLLDLGAAGGELGELQVDGKPLLDFVATDVEMPGTAARFGELAADLLPLERRD